jgi:O-glycosyl hydrolase
MVRKLFFTAALLLPGLAYGGNPSADLSVQVVPAGVTILGANFTANFNDVHQVIDGFGGSDAFSGPGAYGANAMNQLFCVNATDPGCSGPGIGLTLLRQGVGNSVQQNGIDAVARGAKVWGTGWGTGDPNNPAGYDAIANVFSGWATSQIAAGIPLYGLSAQNEPDCGCNGGSYWVPDKHANFQAVLGPKLHALSPPVKLLSPEVGGATVFPQYAQAIQANASANAQVDIFTFHQYSNPVIPPGSASDTGSRHVWETEICDCAGAWDPSIAEAINPTTTEIYDAIVTFGANAWHYWWLISGGSPPTDNSGLIAGNYASPVLTKRYFALGNWSRYVRPGWVRIGVTGSRSGFYGVGAFKNPTTADFAIIAINNSGSDISNVTFGVSGSNICGSVTPYVTSGTPIGPLGMDGNLSAGSASSNVPSSLPVSGGKFISTVPYGVTTFVGKAGC